MGPNPISATPESPNYGNTEFYDMTTTPQAALLSESEIVVCIAKAGCIGTVKMSYESGPYDIYRPSINASRLYDAIEAAILAKLQATQEPVQAGELPDEREAFEAEMRCVEEWGHRSLKKRTNGKYENWQVALMWDVWQARAALSARKPTGAWQDASACPDGDVWFSLSCGHVVMGYKHGSIFDWEASIDHDCCGDATATKAMPITPPDSHRIGLEVKP